MENDIICCPVCKNAIKRDCYCKICDIQYPKIEDIPVLINEKNSLFSFDDYRGENGYTFFGKNSEESTLRKLIPQVGVNYAAKDNYELLYNKLLENNTHPKVLIIGGGMIGAGLDKFLKNENIDFCVTDVSCTRFTQIICDSHDLPFLTGTFDCVIAQAVLEHVVDPYRCVEEMHRVTKNNGIIYAETPFMQQVHGGAYDFTRFTWLGHRRLFRQFEEISSGTCTGPGMALAWSWDYFLRSFSQNKKVMKILKMFSIFTSFYWKYFDYYLKNKANTLDAASGYYFMGRRKENYLLSDKELIKLYDLKKQSYN